MRRLETFDWWPRLVADKDDLSLRELAAKYGVTPGAITAALKRQGITRRPAPPGPRAHRKRRRAEEEKRRAEEAGRQAEEELPPEPGEVRREAERRLVRPDPARKEGAVPPGIDIRPGSKDELIARHLDLVGNMPDRDAAARIGVSMRTLAGFRARNGIPAYKGPRRPRKEVRRPSRIDPYRDLLGTVPDRVVAEKAGVSINAVRNYRSKHNIPAASRGGEAPSASVPVSSGGPGSAPAEAKAWTVHFLGGDARVSRVVVAPRIEAAVSRARGAGLGDIVGIELIGDAL